MNKFSKESSLGVLEPLECERKDFDYLGEKSVNVETKRGYRAKSTLSKNYGHTNSSL